MRNYFALTIAVVLIYSPSTFAHRMLLSCAVKEDRVVVEVFYDDDTPARDVAVKIGIDEQTIRASGATDERGIWSCPKPAEGTYTVWATSLGHKAQGEFSIAVNMVTEVPLRDERTQTPWVRLAVGLGIIAALGWVVWYRIKTVKAAIRKG